LTFISLPPQCGRLRPWSRSAPVEGRSDSELDASLLGAGLACPHDHENRSDPLQARAGADAEVQAGELAGSQGGLGSGEGRYLAHTPSLQVKQVKLVHGYFSF
jgi:hypothetical protein